MSRKKVASLNKYMVRVSFPTQSSGKTQQSSRHSLVLLQPTQQPLPASSTPSLFLVFLLLSVYSVMILPSRTA